MRWRQDEVADFDRRVIESNICVCNADREAEILKQDFDFDFDFD
jgi:hypothetical protein